MVTLLHYLVGGITNLALLVMAEVVLVLGLPAYLPKKSILAQTRVMGYFSHQVIIT